MGKTETADFYIFLGVVRAAMKFTVSDTDFVTKLFMPPSPYIQYV